ncbi:MAG: right-handed parallel beta-helix repeat-containing protein [Planctomycetes bacterium]|nr:right-handed parallel beta-helix repeat-containing protein [Planctomycetota bacterium]
MKTCCIALSVVVACLAAPAEGGKLKVPGDHATIQAAVNAAVAGDVVEVSKGTYFENVTITAKSGITLRAKKGDTVTIDAGGSGMPLKIQLSNYVTVQGLRLRHTGDSLGLMIDTGAFINVTKCTVDDVAGTGISAEGSGIVIDDCTVKNTGGAGIFLEASNSVIRDCTARNSAAQGIVVYGSVNTIEGNSIADVSVGVLLGGAESCASCLVVDNRVEDATDGIFLNGNAAGNSVLDNTIEDAKFDGVELQTGAENNIISGNTIRSVGENGLECDSAYCIYSKNSIKSPTGGGVVIEANADSCQFHKNTVISAGGDGFHVDGSLNSLLENQAKKSGAYDLDDNTAPGSNVYLNNKFKTFAP